MPWWLLLLLTGGAVAVAKVRAAEINPKLAGEWAPVIALFGGRVVPLDPLPDNSPNGAVVAQFRRWAHASGLTLWQTDELLIPNHPDVAARYGYSLFLPPYEWWYRWLAHALVGQALARRAPSGAVVRNLWRPEAYNADPRVGGSPQSYHVLSQAVDVDFAERRDREVAERWIRSVYCKNRWLRMGLGVGRRVLHVDLLGERSRPWQWAYDGTVSVPEGRIPC